MASQSEKSGLFPIRQLPPNSVDAHAHAYLPGFPAQPGGPDLPNGPLPTPDKYRQMMDRLGLSHAIIVQGNAHQVDNGNILAVVAEMAGRANCIGAVRPEISRTELQRLADGGMVGLRIMDLSRGAVGLEHLEAMDQIACDMGWMMTVQFDGATLHEHSEKLRRLRSRWVLDHHGKFVGGPPADSDIDQIKRLLDSGNVWLKFAGCYETSRKGGPRYEDIAVYSQTLARHAPQRIVWGSNWPHNSIPQGGTYPDDADLLAVVSNWFPNDKARDLAFVDNPRELHGLPMT